MSSIWRLRRRKWLRFFSEWCGAAEDVIAGKPAPTVFVVLQEICDQHNTLWERGLPAMRP